MHAPAWLAPLLAAAWITMTGILFSLLVVQNFDLNEGRPTEVPMISHAPLIGEDARVTYTVLGVFSAALLFGASLATYWVLMSSARKHDVGDHARVDGGAPTTRLARSGSRSSNSSATTVEHVTRDEHTGVAPVGGMKKWLGRFGLLCSAVASTSLVVASSATVLTDTHNNSVIAYSFTEALWVMVASITLWSFRRRVPMWLQAIQAICVIGVVSGFVMLVLGLAFFRAKKDFDGEVITATLVATGSRVPDRLMSYFNVFAIGEYVFLGFLALFNLCLSYALRADKVHAHGDVWAQGEVPVPHAEADVEMGHKPRRPTPPVVHAEPVTTTAVPVVPAATAAAAPVVPVAVNAPVPTAAPQANTYQ